MGGKILFIAFVVFILSVSLIYAAKSLPTSQIVYGKTYGPYNTYIQTISKAPTKDGKIVDANLTIFVIYHRGYSMPMFACTYLGESGNKNSKPYPKLNDYPFS